MAVDIKEALGTAYALEAELNKLVEILRIADKGKVEVTGLGDIDFDSVQKQRLTDRYLELKGNLQSLYSQLP